MTKALIGYTGFVGGTLLGQVAFDDLYRSTNIAEIGGARYDLVVCAAAPGQKWKANRDPDSDKANLQMLMGHLRTVRADTFVLISTIDVYPKPSSVDETTPVNSEEGEPYGRHRLLLEEFAASYFDRAFVVRLPGLFGKGLRKNYVYDLLRNPDALHLTHCDSVFQFYDMARLWADLDIVLRNDIRLMNFATEPVSAREVAERAFGVRFGNRTERAPVTYDMRTIHARVFGASGLYIASSEEILRRLARFVDEEKKRL